MARPETLAAWDDSIAKLAEAVGRARRSGWLGPNKLPPPDAPPSFWDEVYPLPDILHESGWLRLTHADLEPMSASALRLEHARVRFRLIADPAPPPWLRERLEALEATAVNG